MSGKPFDNNFRGVLFKNDRKEKITQADYRGSCEVDGVLYFLDAWINQGKGGQKFMSLRFKAKDKQRGTPSPKKEPADFDDDIPF
jgi:hypothetical protein